jgi:uncharacterized coiled-coil DUF342 family protein
MKTLNFLLEENVKSFSYMNKKDVVQYLLTMCSSLKEIVDKANIYLNKKDEIISSLKELNRINTELLANYEERISMLKDAVKKRDTLIERYDEYKKNANEVLQNIKKLYSIKNN